MKWKNKGYELDEYGRKLADRFLERPKVYLFGAGVIGEELRKLLEAYDIFGGYIDNDAQKEKDGVRGAKVFSVDAFLQNCPGYWVVITADEKNVPAMQKQMEARGMRLGEDLFTFRQFFCDKFPILSLWAFQKSCDYLCQISLTERCML